MNDLAFAIRQLRKHPGFTGVVVISLALGIGVNTLIFSVVNAVLLQPLPILRPDQVINLFTSREGLPYGRSSYADYQDLRDRTDAFAGVLARCYWPISVGNGSGKAEVVLGNLVSRNYFEVLGVRPAMGRAFSAVEGRVEGADPVAILSHRLWKRRFASNPEVVGQRLLLNSRTFTVIGVAPEGFTGLMTGMPEDLWIPITMKAGIHPGDGPLEDRGSGWLDIVARLRDGVSLAQAQAAVNTVAVHLANEYPDNNRDKGFVLAGRQLSRFPVMEMARGVQGLMVILMIVVALVLLLTCSNVVSLLLSRATTREAEMAMRLALGASRGRVIRQLLVESMVLSACGGAVGVLLTLWGLELLGLLKPPSMIIPVGLSVPVNARVLGYTAGLSVLVGAAVGLAPAWRSSSLHPYAALRSGHPDAAAGQGHRTRLQRGLVATQVALSFILLVVAGLCLKSLHAVVRIDPGFETRHGLSALLNLSYGNYTEDQGRAFYAALLERVRQLPGVDAASLAVIAPLSYAKTQAKVDVDGYQPQAGESLILEHNIVSPGYFATLEIPILEGRPLDERDQKETAAVVVVNEVMARKFWGRASPIDRTVSVNGNLARIVGVARDSRCWQLTEAPQPHFYLALGQAHFAFASLLVRCAGDPRALIGPVLGEVERLDPNLPITDVKPLSQQLELQCYPTRIAAVSVGAFGLLALAVATVGVYGVMAYAVRQRTHELGVRSALGANRRQILALVIRQELLTTLVGAGVGLTGAVGAARFLSKCLHGVGPFEPLVFIGVGAVLGTAALLACYLPARRASRVNPMEALRCE